MQDGKLPDEVVADQATSLTRPAVPAWLAWAIMLALGLGIWLCDVWLDLRPSRIDPWGWRLLAIFAPTILGLMLRPLPGGVIVLLAVTLTLALDALPPPPPELPQSKHKSWRYAQALGGYMNSSVWLVLAAYFMSRALIQTGLARRIALSFVRLLGKSTLGLSYALAVSDTLLAGMIPSNTARVGGVMLPITKSLAQLYKSHPGRSAGLIGMFLMVALYQADMVACATFLTGQASNVMAADLAARETGGRVELTYARWFLYASLPALVSFLLVPWLVFRLCRPEVTHTPEATEMASEELRAMGRPRAGEWLMMAVFIGVCTGWIFAGSANTTLVAFAGVGVLFLSGVLTWEDAVSEKGAWDVFIWYGGLVQLGTLLNEANVTSAFADAVAGVLDWLPLALLFVAVLLIYFYAHYGFASITAHIISMYPPFIAVLLVAGAPPWLVVVAFAYFSNLAAGLTHYGTTPAPIIFGEGYVSHGTWWRVGFLMSVVNVVVWLGVGLPWWKLWGLW